MILLLDIGNTRIKWAVCGETLGEQRAVTYAGWDETQFRKNVLDVAEPVQRVLVSNVAGERVAQWVQSGVQTAYDFAPEFVRTSPQAAGVCSGYEDHRKLGVDRWISLIAAHAMEPRAVCIANVGTAMTIDGMDANGHHLGGVIVPGPDLMMSSLRQNTSDIAAHAREGGYEGEHLLADNTLGGIYQGAMHALAALIERAVSVIAAETKETPLLIVSGGAHEPLVPLLPPPVQVIPDLVLRGLAVLARAK